MDQSAPAFVNGNPRPASARVAGHFGEIVQGCWGPGGPVVTASLPCPALSSQARFRPARGALHCTGAPTRKAARAAEAALARFAPPGWAGRLQIVREAPAGGGAGSSTADCLAAWRAVARAYGGTASAEEEAAACLAAEGAVDPLMLDEMAVFATREARVVRPLPPLPPMTVLGGFAGPGRATDPADGAYEDVGGEIATLAAAMAAGDADAVGAVATRAAERAQVRAPNPAWPSVRRIVAEAGALGVVVAHTGSAIGLLLRPGACDTHLAARLAEAGVTGVIRFETGAGARA